MTTIINEWQLDCRLNKALNQQHRAEFSLWLAFLSLAVDEMAEFQLPAITEPAKKTDLYATFSVNRPRGYGWQEHDKQRLASHSEALSTGSLPQLKLQQYLTEGPLVLQDDSAKLATAVAQNLDAHSQRRRANAPLTRAEADPTALYDILQQIHQPHAAQ
ncbi:hypothetical protein VT06_04890 [Arsukibacterium sp. MJ3]|uniref:VC2046/SO_2500 family protein n=1 Tax=Arsukibacterium sp. MJ3 TaxID=1632859 RepID=UPI000626FE1E|nr:VC2046/SO_2500 family protein [Arsukibacterium sp. MJ3]KKO49929.1 hypothetical protein VT06_04890 [Arsukibacterium sp. MJ3]